MRQDPLFLLWRVTCPSSAEALRLQHLSQAFSQDTIFLDEVRACPDGVESRRVEPHRLSDYFESVRVFTGDEAQPTAFRLLFQRRPEAGRFWKDLMAQLLQRLREGTSTTTTLEYRGDEEPPIREPGSETSKRT